MAYPAALPAAAAQELANLPRRVATGPLCLKIAKRHRAPAIALHDPNLSRVGCQLAAGSAPSIESVHIENEVVAADLAP